MNDDTFDKVNFVIDSWTTGCDAPWYIYIETMKPAALAAFITLITFGLDDVFRGFFRPKGLGPRRTGKRKGKYRRALRGFPEIGELIGSHIPGAEEVKGQKWSNLAKTLWRIDSAMQAGLFLWLVADVAEDFAFNWTSLLYESYWCQPDPPGQFSYSAPGYFPVPGGAWWVAGFGVEDYEHAPPFWVFNTGGSGAVHATFTAAFNVKTRPPFAPPTSLRVVVRDVSTKEIFADSGTNDELVSGTGSAVATGGVPPGETVEVAVWVDGTNFASYGDGVVIGVEIKE